MKKLIILAFLALVVLPASAQCLKKGNLVGTHIIDLKLNPGVTIDQATDFLIHKNIPAYEQCFKGSKVFLLKWIRGENSEKIGMLVVFENEEARNMYWNADGSLTEKGLEAVAKMESIAEERNKLGTMDVKYTDWVIQ